MHLLAMGELLSNSFAIKAQRLVTIRKKKALEYTMKRDNFIYNDL